MLDVRSDIFSPTHRANKPNQNPMPDRAGTRPWHAPGALLMARQPARQHCHAVLRAFAIADYDSAVAKTNILHPQAQTFQKSQSAPIKQTSHKPIGPMETSENLVHLVASKYDRQTRRCFRAFDTLEPSDLLVEHFFIEEKERAKRLVLRRSRHPTFPGQISEKLRHFRFRHLARMPFAMVQNESANPIRISLLRTQAVMLATNDIAHLIEQFGLVRRGRHWQTVRHVRHFSSSHEGRQAD